MSAGLKQEDPAIGIFGKPVRQHATRRSRADDDVVVVPCLVHIGPYTFTRAAAGSYIGLSEASASIRVPITSIS